MGININTHTVCYINEHFKPAYKHTLTDLVQKPHDVVKGQYRELERSLTHWL